MNQCDEITLNESEHVCTILFDVYREFIILSTSFCQHGEGRTTLIAASQQGTTRRLSCLPLFSPGHPVIRALGETRVANAKDGSHWTSAVHT